MKKKPPSRMHEYVQILPLARKGYYFVNLAVGNEAFTISLGGHKRKEAEWLASQVCKMLNKVIDDELKLREEGKAFWKGVQEYEASFKKRKKNKLT